MSDLKFVMISNALIKVAYVTCVTAAAWRFQNPNLLWWYLLVLLIGYTYKETPKDKKE